VASFFLHAVQDITSAELLQRDVAGAKQRKGETPMKNNEELFRIIPSSKRRYGFCF